MNRERIDFIYLELLGYNERGESEIMLRGYDRPDDARSYVSLWAIRISNGGIVVMTTNFEAETVEDQLLLNDMILKKLKEQGQLS